MLSENCGRSGKQIRSKYPGGSGFLDPCSGGSAERGAATRVAGPFAVNGHTW